VNIPILRGGLFALTLVLAPLAAHATLVSAALAGQTVDGAPLTGFVTYDDSLGGPCKYTVCVNQSRTALDLTIGPEHVVAGTATPPDEDFDQIAEDGSGLLIGAYYAPGRVYELTLRGPAVPPGTFPRFDQWTLSDGTHEVSGTLQSFTQVALRPPMPGVPEPPAGGVRGRRRTRPRRARRVASPRGHGTPRHRVSG
jgi:hypothetical protein